MWWPAVAQTKSPPCSASSPAIASAFSRRSASPVRMTTPVSMSSGCSAGGRVGLVDDCGERRVVDALVALVGGQRHRRLEQRLARDDVVAAGEVLAVAAQVDAGEDDLRAGRADVDADARERDVVLHPDRVLLERLVGIEIEMVVIVVGVAVVVVHEVLAEQMVGERMRLLAVVGVGHRSRLLVRPAATSLVLASYGIPCPLPHPRNGQGRDPERRTERNVGGSLHRTPRRTRHRIRVRQCGDPVRPDRRGALAAQGERHGSRGS